MSLRPCPSCGRHVRHHEPSCPFCATALSPVEERASKPLPRAGRAVIMAFGALATSSTLAGCPGNPMPLYGGPPVDAGDVHPSEDAASTADAPSTLDAASAEDAAMPENDVGGGMNLYGGPPSDAGQTDDSGPVPLYGGAGL